MSLLVEIISLTCCAALMLIAYELAKSNDRLRDNEREARDCMRAAMRHRDELVEKDYEHQAIISQLLEERGAMVRELRGLERRVDRRAN